MPQTAWADPEQANSFADRLAAAAATPPPPAAAPEPVAPVPAPAMAVLLEDELMAPPVPRAERPTSRRVQRRERRAQERGAPGAAAAADAELDAVAGELEFRGVEPATIQYLLATATAHVLPFSENGSVRKAVRAALASTLSFSPPPPPSGGAIAFVGPGGSGKTCCVAGLAVTYSRASTLSAAALALAPSGGASELKAMLGSLRIGVADAEGARLMRRVESGRRGSIVVIDTPAISPAEPHSVTALANELAPLALDQTIIALPATLSCAAGRQLIASLAPLRPTALAITHADETDQLGVALTLACETGLPVAYIHAGSELPGSLMPTNPQSLADLLLP